MFNFLRQWANSLSLQHDFNSNIDNEFSSVRSVFDPFFRGIEIGFNNVLLWSNWIVSINRIINKHAYKSSDINSHKSYLHMIISYGLRCMLWTKSMWMATVCARHLKFTIYSHTYTVQICYSLRLLHEISYVERYKQNDQLIKCDESSRIFSSNVLCDLSDFLKLGL